MVAQGSASGDSGVPSPALWSFQLIPAVDILGEEAVRLERGAFDRVKVRAGDPVELARRFAAARPPWLHVVDLEGARSGRTRPGRVAEIAGAVAPVPVQAAGGVRSPADALALVGAGAARVVVGTAAFSSPDALAPYVEALGGRLVVAVDVRDRRVAVAGWEHSSGLGVDEAVARCVEAGAARLLCTAIERDGALAGPDLELLSRVRERSGLPVLAAGGVRSRKDLDALAEIGLEGAVVGRALLENRLRLS
jgi:phosphoribosylformimino-5-aminoimidazole carboxamide ribotide isomerase